MVQCAELGDISGPFHSGGGEWRHAYASLLETIISARSIVHPTAWLAECTASIAREWGRVGAGVYAWTAAARQVRAAEVNDCVLRQTLLTSHLQGDAVCEEDQWADAVLR